jgi:hypothetical protein
VDIVSRNTSNNPSTLRIVVITYHQLPVGIQKHMPESKLSIRCSKAAKLAYLVAKKERRTVSQVVEPERETAPDFYARISGEYGTDLDLDVIIREGRKPNSGVEL